jgi:hypothetical protein
MKQKLLTRLMGAAFIGLASVSAHAGNINAGTIGLAREVIVSDVDAQQAPRISYRFQGDLNISQTFQVQFTVNKGTWQIAAGLTQPQQQAVFGIQENLFASIINPADYTVVAYGVDAAGTTLWATLSMRNANFLTTGTTQIITPSIVLNNSPASSAVSATLKGLLTASGGPLPRDQSGAACVPPPTEVTVRFRHFVGLANPSAIAAATTNGTEDESVRNASNNGPVPYINFPTNLRVNVTANATPAAPGLPLTTIAPSGAIPFSLFQNGLTGPNAVVGGAVNLGRVTVSQVSSGRDLNSGAPVYALPGYGTLPNPPQTPAGPLTAVAVATIGSAPADLGNVETDSTVGATVVVTASEGYAAGSSVYLSNLANCSTAIAGTTVLSSTAVSNALTIATTGAIFDTIGVAQSTTLTTNPVHVCYQVPGTSTIPGSAFSAVASLIKAPDATAPLVNEQDNVCRGPLYALGGAIKIDVRNYLSNKTYGDNGIYSVVRVINTSETKTADVFFQMIYADGSYGAWGKLAADLKPRAVVTLTNKQLEALLVNAAPTANPFGSAAANYSSSGGAAVRAADNPAIGDRVRISSQTGNTLRVQSFAVTQAGMVFDTSNAQGVDFTSSIDRAPSSEGQYHSQDAQNGIAK